MKAVVTFEIDVEVTVPDDWTERCRQMQREMGENYIGADWDNRQIMEYLALIHGIRQFRWLEAVGADMSKEVRTFVNTDDAIIDFRWASGNEAAP